MMETLVALNVANQVSGSLVCVGLSYQSSHTLSIIKTKKNLEIVQGCVKFVVTKCIVYT